MDNPDTVTIKKVSNPAEYGRLKFFFWLFAICCSLMGVQFVYSIQFSLGSPLFKNELKLKQSVIAVILATSGPISGFFVQPVVGVWSDGCRLKMGRRRPFLLAGCIGCVLGMALIGLSVDLGSLLGDVRSSPNSSDHVWGIVLAISGLMIMNIFVNTIQGPARAIVLDLVPADKQQDGNAMVSGVMGISAIIANLIGVPLFSTDEPYRNLFLLGVVFVIIASVITLIFAKEEQFLGDPDEEEEVGTDASVNSTPSLPSPGVADNSAAMYDSTVMNSTKQPKKKMPKGVCGAFYKIFYAFRHIPPAMIIVVFTYFFSWCAYSPFMIYTTSFFSDNIYGGGANVNKGITMGMYGLAIFSAAQWLFSLVLAPLTHRLPVNLVYFVTQLIASAAYGAFYFIQSIEDLTEALCITYALMAVVAVNFTTMNSVPFGLVRGITGTKNAGLFMGVLNAASVVAQTATNLVAGLILSLTETEISYSSESSSFSLTSSMPTTEQNVTYAIVFGGGLSVLAALCSLALKEKKTTTEDRKPEVKTPDEKTPLINESKD